MNRSRRTVPIPGRALPDATREAAASALGAAWTTEEWEAAAPWMGTARLTADTVDREVDRALRAGVHGFALAARHDHMGCLRGWNRAVSKSIDAAEIRRPALVVALGVGFFAFDGPPGPDPRGRLIREWVLPGDLDRESFVGSSYSIAPRFLLRQVDEALAAAGLERFEIVWIEAPEIARAEFGADGFLVRIRDAFEALERGRADGRLGGYGLSIGRGGDAPPERDDALDLDAIRATAAAVGGAAHGGRYLRLGAASDALAARAREAGWIVFGDRGAEVLDVAPGHRWSGPRKGPVRR